MSSTVEASVDSFFGESPEVERASRATGDSRKTSLSSDSSLSDTENSYNSENSETTSDSQPSTARSSTASEKSATEEDTQGAGDNNGPVPTDSDNKATKEVPIIRIETPTEQLDDEKPNLRARGKSESEGELTDVSPMVTPRPSAAVEDSVDLKEDEDVDVDKELEMAQDIRVSVRPKSAHPSRQRGRKPSTSSSVNSSIISTRSRDYDLDSARNESDIRKHRDRLLYSTSKSTKDLNHLLEAVLVLDQKMADRDTAKDTNPFPPRAVGGSRTSSARGSRKSSFTVDRQREIQKENERLLRELTKQKSRRPMSAVSATSIRSAASSRSNMSGLSAASAVEFRRTANCRAAPIARNYHSRINRTKEAKRIDEENLALLRRLQNVRASPAIQMSRQQVARPHSAKTTQRPKSVRPKIVNTWTDGW